MLSPGSKYIVITVARLKSYSKMSPRMNSTLSPMPTAAAFLRESSTMFGLYSIPRVRAPRFAAAIAMRPSPEPRSITVSAAVTLAMSSIRSTSSGGVGTQTTSLPGCPTSGLKTPAGACGAFCANTGSVSATTAAARRPRAARVPMPVMCSSSWIMAGFSPKPSPTRAARWPVRWRRRSADSLLVSSLRLVKSRHTKRPAHPPTHLASTPTQDGAISRRALHHELVTRDT